MSEQILEFTTTLLACPHCGGRPWFEGDVSRWHDDNRYVELRLVCCASMDAQIGWPRARDMTVAERHSELCEKLTVKWNTRFTNGPEE